MAEVVQTMIGPVTAITAQISLDQLALLAHALSLVDRSKLDFPMRDSFYGDSVAEELDTLQGMFADTAKDPGDHGLVHGFCL